VEDLKWSEKILSGRRRNNLVGLEITWSEKISIWSENAHSQTKPANPYGEYIYTQAQHIDTPSAK
jgi:hypothetical protein